MADLNASVLGIPGVKVDIIEDLLDLTSYFQSRLRRPFANFKGQSG